MRFNKRIQGGLLATAMLLVAVVVPAQAASAAEAQPAADAATNVTLFGITDFHGHIENGGYLATALKETKAKNPNTLFVGAGDLVGASAFESSIADDVPAMEQLKTMGLAVTATGNHEFDKGAADLADRIVPGIAPAKYVVANVTGDVLKDKVQPYAIETIGGKKVAFIGGVFGTLEDSVSPAGMKGITVTDPIDAVNKYADELSDGNEQNGEADAVVALVHADANDLTGLDANVDAVLGGHTHVYETAKTKSGAPIIETANYGTQYSTTDLQITGTGKDAKVTATAEKHDVFDKDGKTPLYQSDEAVNKIYTDAKAAADAKGNEQLGTLAEGSTFNRGASKPGDLTTRGNNRGVESTLGILNGNAAKWAADQAGQKADIGVINAGGLRADLDPNNDGKVTLKEAHDVLPFGNSNAVVTLTGAQLKTLIEEQWQPANAQRPVLWLGFSDNVKYNYNTYNATIDGKTVPRAKVYDLTVNGKAVQPTDTFKIAGNSFLLAGGDNFTVFQKGTGYVDTGYIDFDGFSDYLKANPGLEAPKARNSAGFSAVKLDGNTVSFTVSGLAFTTDEPRPWGIKLTANGVDFGNIGDLDFTGEEKGPGAGSVTVTKTLTDAEKATFLENAKKAEAIDGQSLSIADASVETLATKPSDQPQPQPTEPALALADENNNALKALSLKPNDKKTVRAFVKGENVEGTKIYWQSSDPEVVSFAPKDGQSGENGKSRAAQASVAYDEQTLLAHKDGNAIITVTATVNGKDLKAELPVAVRDGKIVKPSLYFTDANGKKITSLKLKKGASQKVWAIAEGKSVEGKPVQWKSSDPQTVSFAEKTAQSAPNNGSSNAVAFNAQTLLAHKDGKATITVTATIDGKALKAELPVTVGETAPAKTAPTADKTAGKTAGNGLAKTGTDMTLPAVFMLIVLGVGAGAVSIARRQQH